MNSLSDQDRAVLEFERLRWPKSHAGARDGEILRRFGWTPSRYALVLNRVLEEPAALAYDAQLVNRLRRLKEQRKAMRLRP